MFLFSASGVSAFSDAPARQTRPPWYEIGVLPSELLEVLVCPKSKQPLIYFPRGVADAKDEDAFLVCPASKLRYRVERGVPVLLVDEAESLTDQQVSGLVSRAKELGLDIPAP